MFVSCWLFETSLKRAFALCHEFFHIFLDFSICAFQFYIVKLYSKIDSNCASAHETNTSSHTASSRRLRVHDLTTPCHPTSQARVLRLVETLVARLPPSRQDRFATLGPLLAVLLFLSAIVVAISYLRYEELEREQEAVTRDVEYAQQRLRLRLLERQEQLMRLARDVDNKEIATDEFEFQVESLISQFPELMAVTWVDARRNVLATYASPSAPLASQMRTWLRAGTQRNRRIV